ncbi:MAG: hypothetical protein V3T70_02910, partial [Phycisphaerae bacterium]
YHYRPNGRYVVALDPVFFYRDNPALFDKAVQAYRGMLPNFYDVLRNDFDARWIYLPRSPQHEAMFNLIQRDSRFQQAYMDANVMIFQL